MKDPTNALTFTSLLASKSHATNNIGSTGLDLKGYAGRVACRVNIGIKTAGDNDGAITVQIKASATNALANATNITGTTPSAVSTTNNTAASGTIGVDVRAEFRYLFALVTLSGTNSPAYPVAVEAVGIKQVEP